MAEPPREDRATLFAEKAQVIPEGALTVKVTVLLKPLDATRVIVEFPKEPALIVVPAGLAAMVKSTTWNMIVALWVSGPLVAVTKTLLLAAVV